MEVCKYPVVFDPIFFGGAFLFYYLTNPFMVPAVFVIFIKINTTQSFQPNIPKIKKKIKKHRLAFWQYSKKSSKLKTYILFIRSKNQVVLRKNVFFKGYPGKSTVQYD